MRDISTNKSIQFWINKRCGSETTVRRYKRRSELFFEWAGIEPDELVAAWKKVRYDYRLREQFIDEWTEKIEDYIFNRLENYTPLSRLNELGMVESFFKAHKIPVEPDKPKHPFVKFHNRDITREEIKRILEHTTMRNKAFFLMMAESGLRPYTLVQLRYKHIKKDFEANTVPMKIDLPSELLKDRVEARWTFIGADGFKVLKAYLKPRLPLQEEDLIFLPRRSDTKHDFLLPQTFTNIFGRVALKLGITETTEKGKPKQIRLYCLRKFFNNNCRYEGFDPAYKEFWMAHETTQTHYISRDPERHREEYKQAYENLRIYKTEQPQNQRIMKEQAARINQLENALERQQEELNELRGVLKFMEKPSPYVCIPGDLNGEERLKMLENFVRTIMSDIEEIKRTGSDFWEKSAAVKKWIKKKAEELAETKGIKYEEALNQAKAQYRQLEKKAKRKKQQQKT